MSTHAHAQPGESGHAAGRAEPQTAEEITRRRFMANATITIGGVIGLVLAIPIVGSLIPDVGAGGATWTPLDAAGWKELQSATDKAVKIDFNLRTKDAYLPMQSVPESVWGIKVKDVAKFKAARTDLFTPAGKDELPYEIVTMGFVLFSPICPHLGCRYNYDSDSNKFLCPCHGSQFDELGAHIAGPAARGLDPLPLREQSGGAQVEWIRYKATIPDRIVVSYSS